MPEYTAEVMARFLTVDSPEFTRLVRDGHIPKAKRKDGEDYFDLTAATQGYIGYLRHRAEARGVSEIAALFGVTVRQIQLLTADGIIKTAGVIGGRAHGREYDLKETCTAIYAHLSAKASGKSATEKEAALKSDKLKAEIALKESQGELHRLRTAIARKEYIAVEEVRSDYQQFFITFKKFAMSLPSRLVTSLGNAISPPEARRVEREIQQEIRANLTGFVVAGFTQEDVKQSGNRRKKKEEIPQVSGPGVPATGASDP